MDALGRDIVRADELLWRLPNALVGPAVLVATFLYAPPGTHSLGTAGISLDPFYLLVPLSLAYTCWVGVGLWSRYGSDTD
jgi:hypothetical protein